MKVAHYLNQFFAGFGAEEQASMGAVRVEGAVGPGRGLGLPVAVTYSCGDDYFGEAEDAALVQLLGWIAKDRPDVLVCGPAFGSGRYGYACGSLAREAARRGVPAVTAMEPDNPGVVAADGWAYVVPTTPTVIGMRQALAGMAAIARLLGIGGEPGSPEEAGYLPRSIRRNVRVDRLGADRAVDLLLAKISGDTLTEIAPPIAAVEPPPPVPNMTSALIALVTESGCVPRGNPDHLTSRRSSRWLRYTLDGVATLDSRGYETVHGGYDTTFANGEPNRIVPLDALRASERNGNYGALHPFLYTTSGVDTSVANAVRFGQEIGAELLDAGVTAVVLTGT